jgi:spermidine/putrescine transport system permease protein
VADEQVWRRRGTGGADVKKRPLATSRIFMFFIFLFLYAPIFILIAFSFNSTKSRTVWTGFTFDWYSQLFQDSSIMSSLSTTLTVSILAAVIATIGGTFAAIGLYSMKRRWSSPLLAVSNIPVMNADIVTGVSLCLLFVSLGSLLKFDLGFGTLLIAHITFNLPYVILSIMPKLRQLDKNLVDAAQDLGCTPLQAFLKVVIPEIMPGIINGMIIAFTMSIDDFVISYFTAGSKVQTLSMVIYSMTKHRVSPKINAVSTLLFISVLALLLIINIREARQEDRLKKQMISK